MERQIGATAGFFMTIPAVRLAKQLAAWHAEQPFCFAPYAAKLPDTEGAVALLWSDLCGGLPPQPWSEGPSHPRPLTEQQVRHLLLLLIHLDGWRRIKSCQHAQCQHIFIDASNALNRKWCGVHSRHHPS